MQINNRWNLFLGIALTFLSAHLSGASCDSSCFPCYEYDCARWCDDCDENCHLHAAQPYDDCDCGFFFGGEFIWWTAYQPDLDYVQKNVSNTPSIGPGDLVIASYKWCPGFRGTMGWRWGEDGWDSTLNYTYIEIDKRKEKVESNDTDLGPVLYHPYQALSDASLVTPDLDLHYQTLDALFSRPTNWSRTLIVRPFFGVRALWLEQSIDVEYSDGITVNRVKNEVGMDAYGLTAGWEWNTNLGDLCGAWGVNTVMSASVLANHTESHLRHISGEIADDIDVDVKSKEWLSLPGIHLALNLSWENCFDCAYLFFKAGYEFNHWFHVPQMRRYVDGDYQAVAVADHNSISSTASSSFGYLLLHGVTARVEVHF